MDKIIKIRVFPRSINDIRHKEFNPKAPSLICEFENENEPILKEILGGNDMSFGLVGIEDDLKFFWPAIESSIYTISTNKARETSILTFVSEQAYNRVLSEKMKDFPLDEGFTLDVYLLEREFPEIVNAILASLNNSENLNFKDEFAQQIVRLKPLRETYYKSILLAVCYLYSGEKSHAEIEFRKAQSYLGRDSENSIYLNSIINMLESIAKKDSSHIGILISKKECEISVSADIVFPSINALRNLDNSINFKSFEKSTYEFETKCDLKDWVKHNEINYLICLGHGNFSDGMLLQLGSGDKDLEVEDLEHIFKPNLVDNNNTLKTVLLFACNGRYYETVSKSTAQSLIYDFKGSDNQRAEIFSIGFFYAMAKNKSISEGYDFGSFILSTRNYNFVPLEMK